MQKLLTLTMLAATALASCASLDPAAVSDNRLRGVLLAESTTPDGAELSWRAYPGNAGKPRIERTTTTTRVVARIGMKVSPVDRKRATSIGATPFTGVWIDRVDDGLPANRAGLVPGDIVLAVAGEAVSSAEQFQDAIARHAAPDQPLLLTVRLDRRPGEDFDRDPSTEVTITPMADQVRESNTDSISLDRSTGVQTYTGLQAAALDPELAGEVYGDEGEAVLVTGVVAGSPAYMAGLRAGDRIRTIDGLPVGSLQDLNDAVLARVRGQYPDATTLDLAFRGTSTSTAQPRTDAIQVTVDGPLGPHATEFDVTRNVDRRTQFYVPILTNYESRVNRSKWSFLHFIFQFGFTHRARYHPSSTRQPIRTSEFSLFPFGMFEVDHGVDSSEYTFLWFIDFEVDN